MTDSPVRSNDAPLPSRLTPQGRQADLWAALIASSGAIFAVIGAIWFFAGFAENDTRPEHLASAALLTLGLFALAAGPFAVVAELARRAYRTGGRIRHYFWTLGLMLPWVGLSVLVLDRAPLPAWPSLLVLTLSGLLAVWALVSLILDLRNGLSRKT